MTVANLTLPTITGTAKRGSTLMASPGTWSHDLEDLSYDYQWERCDASGASCVDIGGATSNTYVVQSADVGHTIRVQVTATESAAPPPSSAYFFEDFSTGDFQSSRWVDLYSYTSPGFFAPTRVGTPDNRVQVVNDPAGGGGKCARVEIRDSDPEYPQIAGVDKSEIVTDTERTYDNGGGGVNYGDVRWFRLKMYLPYGAEKFEWAHGGSQPYLSMLGFHPPGPTGWSAFHIGWEAWQVNHGEGDIFLNMFLQGGIFPENTYNEVINIARLTDSGGSRYMANHNRWLDVVRG